MIPSFKLSLRVYFYDEEGARAIDEARGNAQKVADEMADDFLNDARTKAVVVEITMPSGKRIVATRNNADRKNENNSPKAKSVRHSKK